MSKATDSSPQPLAIAVLTVSDTRTEADDTSGQYLQDALEEAGHRTAARGIVVDDIYQIRGTVRLDCRCCHRCGAGDRRHRLLRS